MLLVVLVIVGACAELRLDDACSPGGLKLLTDAMGNLSSPGRYPDFYTNLHCEWHIRAPEGYTVMLKFKSIELSQSGGQTGSASLSINEESSLEQNVLYRWTGESTMHGPARPDPIISYTNQVYIVFHASGEENEVNLEGFYLDYRFLPAGTSHPGECVDYGPIRNGRKFPPHGPYRIGDMLRLECASGTESDTRVGDLLKCEQQSESSFPQWRLQPGNLLSDVTCEAKCNRIDESSSYGALRSPGWPDPDHEETNSACLWKINPESGYGLRLYFNSTDFRTDEEYLEVVGRNLDSRFDQLQPYPTDRTLEARPKDDFGRVTVAYYGNVIRGSSVEIFFSSGYCHDPGNIHSGSRQDFSTAPTNGPPGVHAGKVFLPGDHVTYSCDPGYELVGPATLTCAPGTIYKYHWDNSRPYCIVASWPPCEDPGIPDHGAQLNPEGYDVGKTVKFTCNTGYYVSGSQARTCGPRPDRTSVWSGMQPTCVPTPCKMAPAAPAHAQVTTMELPNPLRYVAVFECDAGYVMTSGSPVRTCRDGKWDGETPVCEGNGTTPLPTPTGQTTPGRITTSGTTASDTTAGPTTPAAGDTTTEITTTTSGTTTVGETTEDIFTLSHPSTAAVTTTFPWITTTQPETTTIDTTTQQTTTIITTPSGTTMLVTTSEHPTTTEITTNPTTQPDESTTIARTTKPEASTLTKITETIPTEAWTATTLPNTPTVTSTSNVTKVPPGKLRRTVNTGAAIGGSVSAFALVAAVIAGFYYYRRMRAKEGEMSDWHRLRMGDSQPYRATTRPETEHLEEPFSLDGAVQMEDITAIVISDAPWGHNPAFQDDDY